MWHVPALVAGLVLAGGFGVLYVLPYVLKKWQERELLRRCQSQRALVLTYDDGPDVALTPDLLDLLASRQARATFFLLGEKAAACPHLADRLQRDGHELGCHSAHHRHFRSTLPWNLTRDMEEGYRLLAPWLPRTALYRPPYGKAYLPVLVRLALRKSRPAWWTVDSGDTFAARPSVDAVLERVRRAGGGVVLMHDHAGAYPGHGAYVIEMTGRLLDMAQQEGLTLRRMSEVLSLRGQE